MKITFLALFTICVLNLYAQSDSIERAILSRANQWSKSDNQKIEKKWSTIMQEFKGYPVLPTDQSGQVYFTFVADFSNLSKEKIFNRTLEWLSIYYALYPNYIYSNLADGIIIFNNSTDMATGHTCTYNSIITVKDGKIRIEFFRIAFQRFYEGHSSGGDWVPDISTHLDFKQIYPIILKDPKEWIIYLNLLKNTKEFFISERDSLCYYILNWDDSNKF